MIAVMPNIRITPGRRRPDQPCTYPNISHQFLPASCPRFDSPLSFQLQDVISELDAILYHDTQSLHKEENINSVFRRRDTARIIDELMYNT